METLVEFVYAVLWEAILWLSGILLGLIILWNKNGGKKSMRMILRENDLEEIRLQVPNVFSTFLLATLILLISLLLLGLLWVGLHKLFLLYF